MGLFSRKQRDFKFHLTYGDDVAFLYQESKRIKREENLQRERIRASAEYKRQEELANQRKELEKQYEALLGKKHGFDTSAPGVILHIKDYAGHSRCAESPFDYHAILYCDGGRDKSCIFCGEQT